jgi:hypothetical protein
MLQICQEELVAIHSSVSYLRALLARVAGISTTKASTTLKLAASEPSRRRLTELVGGTSLMESLERLEAKREIRHDEPRITLE